MSSSDQNSRSQKSKLSLQKKIKVDLTSSDLNETCEFRSVEKMKKFVSAVEISKKSSRTSRRGKSAKQAIDTEDKSSKIDKRTKFSKIINLKSSDTANHKHLKISNGNPTTEMTGVTNSGNVKSECFSLDDVQKDDKVQELDIIEINYDEEDSKGTCMACGKEYGSEEMTTHLQKCLKTKFQRRVNSDNGKLSDEEEQSQDKKTNRKDCVEKEVKTGDVDLKEEIKTEGVEESFFCQICQKDLSHMNSQRRTQHLNRCMDKDEEDRKEKKMEKKALEDAKKSVLGCPMCGRPCKTENARKVHVKKCAQKLSVSTEQMLKLMKDQEEEHQMLIAAGVLPTSALNKLKNKSSSSTVLTKTKKAVKEPKSHYDEDLQMAMAISMSENKVIEKVEIFPKKGKKKKGVGEPSMLVALTDDEKKRRLSQRVSNMLVPQEDDEDIDLTPEFARSNLEDKYSTVNSLIPKLWCTSSLLLENKENLKKGLFYVESLVPPLEVSKVVPGSKVRRMSEIPGRETSFIKPKTPLKTTRNQIQQSNSLLEDMETLEDTMIASTQTAVLLAELAADITQTSSAGDITQVSSEITIPHISSGPSELDCSGFCPELPIAVQPSQSSGLLAGLQNSMLSMVNSPSHSDLQIHTEGGDTVFCHKVILSCRCPGLLKEEENGHISLPSTSSSAVKSLMTYVYGGKISVTESSLIDVIELADRFNMVEFLGVCKGIQTKVSSLLKSPEKVSQSQVTVESLLKQLWSDSEEEEDEDQDPDVKDDGIDEDLDPDVKDDGMDEDLDPDVKDDGIDEDQDPEIRDDVINENQDLEVMDDGSYNDPVPEVRDDGMDNLQGEVSETVTAIDCFQNSFLGRKDSVENSDVKNGSVTNNCLEKLKGDEQNIKLSIKNSVRHSLRKTHSESLILENDELEVYSNSSSPEKFNVCHKDKSPIYDKKVEFCENVKDTDNDFINFNSDREFSPEIPILPNAKKVSTSNFSSFYQKASDLTSVPVMSHQNYGPCISKAVCFKEEISNIEKDHTSRSVSKTHVTEDDFDEIDLPAIESPRKTRDKKDKEMLMKPEIRNSPLYGDKDKMTDISLSWQTPKSNGGKTQKQYVKSLSQKFSEEVCNFDEEEPAASLLDNSCMQTKNLSCETSENNIRDSHEERINSHGDYFDSHDDDIMHRSFDNSSDCLIVSDEEPSNHNNADSKTNLNLVLSNAKEDYMNGEKCHPVTDYTCELNTSLNISGGDLFASPSPKIQNNTQVQIRNSLSPANSILCSENDEDNNSHSLGSMISPAFRKAKRKTFEMESPRKAFPSPKKFRLCIDNLGASKSLQKDPNRSSELNENLKCDDDFDISIIGDNLAEISQNKSAELSPKESESPKFKSREKKKWKFTSKTNFVKSSDITFSGEVENKKDIPLNDPHIATSPGFYDDDKSVQNSGEKLTNENSDYSNLKPADDSFNDSGFNLTQSVYRKTSALDEHENNEETGDEEVNLINDEESERKESNITMEYDMNVSMVTDQDVWEDFDDCGGAGGFDGVMMCETPMKPSLQSPQTDVYNSESKKSTEYKIEKHIEGNNGCETPAVEPAEFENLTFFEGDSFVDVAYEKPSTSNPRKNSFKTPVMNREEKERLKRNWVEPSPFTPMPNFDAMATPQIKQQVQSYGVKPVGKKRMIKLLKEIYHKTHQYETDSEFEEEKYDEIIEVNKKDNDDSDELDEDFNDSQNSQESDLIEESIWQSTEEESEPVKPGEKPLEVKLMDFIRNQPDIQVRILMYEPLELEILKQKITDAQIKCSMDKLKEFLDDKCITFTMKNMRKSPRKKRRSPKKSKGQGSPKGQKSPSKGRGRGKKNLNLS